MSQEIIVGIILVLACVFLFRKYRKSIKSKSCTCCGGGGSSSSTTCAATGEAVCHCHDKK